MDQGASLQNNLQLILKLPTDRARLGNQEHKFRKDPLFDDVNNDGMVFDKGNNVEMTRIDQRIAGTYLVRVFADNMS